MRFLLLTQYFPPEIGGPQTRLYSMAVELQRSGHEVEIVTARPNYPRGAFFDGQGRRLYVHEMRNGISVHRVWLFPAMGGGLGRVLNYLTFTLTCLYGVFRCKKPDYLFVEAPPLTTSIPAYIAARCWGVPFVFNVADLWPDAIVENGFLKKGFLLHLFLALENWSYRKADCVNAVTEGIRDTLTKAKNVSPAKVLFLPNGVDTSHYQYRSPDRELKRRLGLEGKRVILWAGTLGFAHGLEYVLQAAQLLGAHPEIHFLFVGDGSARKELERTARQLNLVNTTFHDPVQIADLPPYYSIAECGLASLRALPTHEGARPSKIFPVLASGKPLIFVGRGECANLVESANAGIVVPPEDPPALAREILQFFGQPEVMREYGENGRRFIELNFDWSRLVNRWVSQLRTVDRPAGMDVQPSVTNDES